MTERLVCTVITKSYLAHARTLAATLAAHHSELKLYVLLADRVDGYFDPNDEPFEIIQLEDLPEQDTIRQLCFYYTPFELCCALRGALHDYIFHHTSAESWLFLDADIMVCHSLDSIFEQLTTVSILLTPHCQTPVQLQDTNSHEFNFLRSGLSNAGFLGLRRTEETRRFITWFKERLTYYCFNDQVLGEPRGLFVDQLWLNLVLLYFKEVAFLKEPGANIGHWNLYEKQLTISEENTVTIEGKPLLFFHFSGWNIDSPFSVSFYSQIYNDYDNSAWIKLAESYKQKLLEADYETVICYPYAFGQFSTGELISLDHRRTYYEELFQGKAIDISPFESFSYFQKQPERYRNFHEALAILMQVKSEFAQVQANLTQTQANLTQTQAEFAQVQANLTQTQAEFAQVQSDRAALWTHIQTIENSKFWKLAKVWGRIKQSLKATLKR